MGVRGKGARKWPAAPFDLRLRRYGYGRLRAADRRMPSQASPQGRKSADDSQAGPGHRARAGLAPHKPAFHSSSGSMISRQGWASSYSIASSVETSMITSYRPAARHSISDTWLWPCRHRVGSARLRFSGVWPIHRVLWVSWRYSRLKVMPLPTVSGCISVMIRMVRWSIDS